MARRVRAPPIGARWMPERLGVPVTPEMLSWRSCRGLMFMLADHGLKPAMVGSSGGGSAAEVVEVDAVDRGRFLALTGMALNPAAPKWLFDPARLDGPTGRGGQPTMLINMCSRNGSGWRRCVWH